MQKLSKKEQTKKPTPKTKLSHKFITALAIVSLIGFSEIIVESFFNLNVSFYTEALLMFVIGIGLILEAKLKKLRSLPSGINPNNFTHLITIIVGAIAILTGVFSFPSIRLDFPAFHAVKGILSIIAIIVIIIQTWVID